MRQDLQKLLITENDFKKLSGISLTMNESKTATSSSNWFGDFIGSIFGFWILGLICCYFFSINFTYNLTTIGIILGLSLVASLSNHNNSNSSSKNNNNSEDFKAVMILAEEVNNYNSILKSMDINDQLVEAGGGKAMSDEDRKSALDALQLTKEDLERSLKIEKILRENKKFIDDNSTCFESNLNILQTLQIREKATELSSIIGDAVRVSTDVQEEMRKLMKPIS